MKSTFNAIELAYFTDFYCFLVRSVPAFCLCYVVNENLYFTISMVARQVNHKITKSNELRSDFLVDKAS